MFEERIKELRTSMGLNQIQFGRKLFVTKQLHVTKQCISNWENGNIQPSIDMLIRIAQTFSVSTDYLLGLNDKPTLSAEGLTSEQILHLRAIIDDIRKKTDDQ